MGKSKKSRCEHILHLGWVRYNFHIFLPGSDLMSVCRLANTQLLFDECESEQSTSAPADPCRVLIQSLRSVRPSAMKEISLQVPHVNWSDIGGLVIAYA